MRYAGLMLLLTTVLVTVVLGPTASAANRDDNEVPEIFPGVWYRIAFDENGDKVLGDGDGDGWHYYPASNTWRMWFYNNPYDPDRRGYLNYEVYIKGIDANTTTYAAIYFNWTTPQWSALGRSGPPMPGDVPTLGDESQYMSRQHLTTVDNWQIGTVEPIRSWTIENYNPEWVSIDIIGRNAYIYRGAWHECLDKVVDDPDDPDDPDDDQWVVCCNRTTGHCYTIYGGNCADGYEALPKGQTCNDCVKTSDASLDFGDAPDPAYPTLSSSNGARHTIVPGVFLGKSVDAETDGQPNGTATGDDNKGSDEDGVVFVSAIQSGELADIDVTASVDGYLNAWIDFDGNGRFDGHGEQIFNDEVLGAGVNQLTIDVPDDAVLGTTFARFRFNTRGLLDCDGQASDGEVEDYAIQIVQTFGPYPTSGLTAAKWNQPPAAIDTASPFFFEGIGTASSLDLHRIAADDLQFQDTLPVTGMHWWGTFDGWTESYLPVVTPLAFHVGIWTDVLDGDPKDPGTFNHPGTLVWECYCTAWTWALAGYQQSAAGAELGDTCFQFSQLLSQDQWFHPTFESSQDGSEPGYYWVSVASFYDPQGQSPQYEWGWLSRPHANGESAILIEDTVNADSGAELWPPTPGAQWQQGDSIQDGSGAPCDLAFQVTTYGAMAGDKASSKDKNAQARGFATLSDIAMAAQPWLNHMP